MERYGELSVDATMRYSDIIVPTLDTVRSLFLIELLLTNNKRVSVYIRIFKLHMFSYSHQLDCLAKMFYTLLRNLHLHCALHAFVLLH